MTFSDLFSGHNTTSVLGVGESGELGMLGKLNTHSASASSKDLAYAAPVDTVAAARDPMAKRRNALRFRRARDGLGRDVSRRVSEKRFCVSRVMRRRDGCKRRGAVETKSSSFLEMPLFVYSFKG